MVREISNMNAGSLFFFLFFLDGFVNSLSLFSLEISFFIKDPFFSPTMNTDQTYAFYKIKAYHYFACSPSILSTMTSLFDYILVFLMYFAASRKGIVYYT